MNWSPQLILSLIQTDKAHFSLHSDFNIEICHIWATSNFRAYTTKQLHFPYFNASCKFTASFILVSLFFKECFPVSEWKTCSVTAERYLIGNFCQATLYLLCRKIVRYLPLPSWTMGPRLTLLITLRCYSYIHSLRTE